MIDAKVLNKLKRKHPESLFISAQKELKINELLDRIQEKLSELNEVVNLNIPYDKLSIIDFIYKTAKVIKREDGKVLKPEGWKPPNLVEFLDMKNKT